MAFALPIRIYWEDTDAGGIVFYANYLKFFERARTEWLRSLGIEQHRLRQESGGMFVVLETSARYRRPARLDDSLVVSAALKDAKNVSLALTQEARMAAGGELLCEASIRIGWVDARTLRPARIPDAVIAAVKDFAPK